MAPRLTTVLFFLTAGLVALLSFVVIGPYNMKVDGVIYLAQIEQFDTGEIVTEPFDVALRAFKPFYAILGALLVPLFTAAEAVQLINLLFLFGLPFVAFGFLRELRFSTRDAIWGATWITAGYPVLKYGLAISTDIAGWFFTLATAFVALYGLRRRSIRLLIMASILGFVGATAKETGVMGLVFAGLLILFTVKDRSFADSFKFLVALAAPAFVLEMALFAVLMINGFPTFFDWYAMALGGAGDSSVFSLRSLVGVLGSTFSILLVYAFVGTGTFTIYGRNKKIDYRTLVALLAASLPVLFWTTIISRILFVQCIIVVPLALLGFRYLVDKSDREHKREAEWFLGLLPIAAAVTLFIIAGQGSLFEVFSL